VLTALTLIVAGVLLGAWTPDLERAELAQRHGYAAVQTVEVKGSPIQVKASGPEDAPAVLMLHGFASSLHTWETWAQGLDAELRVLRIDLPGFGLTGPAPDGDYSLAHEVATLTALIQTLGLRDYALVGHSMGGQLAAHIAAHQPAGLKALVLVAPDGLTEGARLGERVYPTPTGAGLITDFLPENWLASALAQAFHDPQAMSPDLVRRYHDMLRAPGVRAALLARAQQRRHRDDAAALRHIAVPTLILWGAEDQVIPSTQAARFALAVPDARVQRLPGVGHLPQEERAADGLRVVRDFLSSVLVCPKACP
jgi:pimeloyl-ACP methyl ester carboxylesterase